MASKPLTRVDNDARTSGAKERALDLALKQIEKQYGRGAIMRLGDAPVVRIASISTGSLAQGKGC
jgi:recombination protein RecA